MSREITNYDIIDTFDQNKLQTVLMGIDNSNYQDIVIINKLYKSNSINQLFIDKYKKFSENIVSVTDSDNEFIVINQYEQAALISDFLNENSLDLNERIRLGKSFLYQISDYEGLETALQLVFIHADQLTIKNGVLKFSNYILLKDYHSETTPLDILREIGKTLEVILQLHKEKLTSDLSSLQQFIYKLLNANETPHSYNDLYNNFKVIAANLQADEIMYTPLFTDEVLVQSNNDDLNQIRIPKDVEESITHIPNAEIEDIKITYESIDDHSTDGLLDVMNKLEEDEIYLIEDDIDLIEKASDETIETITFDYHELGDEGDLVIESLDENDELIIDVTPSEETIDSAIDQLLKFTEPDKTLESNITIADNIDISNQNLSESNDVGSSDKIEEQTTKAPDEVEIVDKTIYEMLESFDDEAETIDIIHQEESKLDVVDIFNDDLKIVSEPVDEDIDLLHEQVEDTFNENDAFDSEPTKEFEATLNIEALPPIDVEDINNSFDTTSEDDSIITEEEIVEMDNQRYFHDEKHHSVVLTNDNTDPIQEILDRNDKQYSDLYVSEKKKKKRFLPTFLLFFIILIVITSLLIYYTSSYM